MMKKLTAMGLAFCVAASVISGCAKTASKETEAAKQEGGALSGAEAASGESSDSTEAAEGDKAEKGPEQLVLTYVTSPLNVPTIVERAEGIFERSFAELGTEVSYAEITSGADQTQALASGDVQVLYAVGATSVILSAANGADIKVLNMYSRSPKAFAMYTADESLNSPESLRGKTIAGPTGTNLHELLAAYLAKGGLEISDVNYVNMSIPDAKAGLDGGSVDVALVAGATAYQAAQQGYHLVADGEGLIDALIAVAVSESYAEAHPEVLAVLGNAQQEIAAFMTEEPEETMTLVAETLDLSEEAVQEMEAMYDFSTEITEKDRAGFQKTADFMYQAGMIETEFDVSQLFME